MQNEKDSSQAPLYRQPKYIIGKSTEENNYLVASIKHSIERESDRKTASFYNL